MAAHINLHALSETFKQGLRFYSPTWTIAHETEFLDAIAGFAGRGMFPLRRNRAAVVDAITRHMNSEFQLSKTSAYYERRLIHLIVRCHRFKALLQRTGVSWDPDTNELEAPLFVWEELVNEGKTFMMSYYSVGERNYQNMLRVFMEFL